MLINRSDTLGVFYFENSLNTSDSGGSNGTVTGTEQYADSISGKGFDFNGSTRVGVGQGSLSNSTDLTILMKMNLDSLASGDVMFAKKTSGITKGFLFNVNNAGVDDLRWRVRNAADSAFIECISTLPENNVYAVMLEIELGVEIRLSYYKIDGTLTTVSTAFTDSTYATDSSEISIGNQISGQACDGKIDEVIIKTGIFVNPLEEFYRYYLGLGISDL